MNKKKIISLLLSLTMLGSIIGVPVLAEEYTDIENIISDKEIANFDSDIKLQSSSDVYYIYTADDLDAVRNDLTATYYLMNDIDLSSYTDWEMFGIFSGVFDGNNYTISGINTTSSALFEVCNGTIQNLNIEININYNGDSQYVGGLVARLGMSAKDNTLGTLFNCHAKVNIVVESSANILYTGGLIGKYIFGSVKGCSSVGTITTKGITTYVGGLTGYEYGSSNITGDSYSRVTLKDTSTTAILGGIAGKQNSTYYNSYSACSISSTAANKTIGAAIGETSEYSYNHNIYYNKSLLSTNDSGIGTGKTTSALKTSSSFEMYDFNTMWEIKNDINDGYPYINYRKPLFSGGDGSENNPYIISTAKDFNDIRYNLTASYKINNDILLDKPILPLAMSYEVFSGNIEGNKHSISNIIFPKDKYNNVGLFARVGSEISNLNIKYGDIDIIIGGAFGSIASRIDKSSVFDNCSVQGNININTYYNGEKIYIGGIVGSNYESRVSFENCNFTGTININAESSWVNVGGILGNSESLTEIKNCYSFGTMNVNEGGGCFGGIIGYGCHTTITYSFSEMAIDINASGDTYIGGMVGDSSRNKFKNCYYKGNISSKANMNSIGGIIGYNNASYGTTMESCIALGNIKSSAIRGTLIGGLAGCIQISGTEYCTISNSYSNNKIEILSAETARAGGLIGDLYSTSKIELLNSYSAAEIIAVFENINTFNKYGICYNKKNVNISDTYYDSTISGCTDTGNGTPKTTSQMKSQSTYLGWDFTNTWAIDSSINDGYPYLRALQSAYSTPVTGISLNKNNTTLNVGSTETLTATVSPSNATNKNVTWSSSNTSVATVSSSGVVAAKSAGTATITVKTVDGNKTASCIVTVKNPTVSVTGVSLNKNNTTLNVGATETFTATVSPSNATNKNVTWSSSNTNVATVSSTGVVTAKSTGTATITVRTTDGSKTASCAITVKTTPSKSFTMLRDNYSFANTWSSFGYNSTYRIPIERFISVFGVTEGTQRYNNDGYWGGSCYGFSATSSLFFENHLNYKQYDSKATSVYNMSAPKIPRANLTVLMERYQIAQMMYDVSRERSVNYNNYKKIIDAVKNFEKTGENPIVLCVWRTGGGHAIVPYKCVEHTDGSYSIYVYDNNYPTSKNQIVKINKDMKSFYYDRYNSGISFNYASTVYNALEGVSIMSAGEDVATITINSDNVDIMNVNGVDIKNIEGAYEVIPVEVEYDTSQKEYVVPIGDYIIKNKKSDLNKLQVSIANSQDYQAITTDDLNATINVGVYGSNGRVYAYVNSANNSNNSIKTLNSAGVSKLLEAVGKSLGASASSNNSLEVVADSSVLCNGTKVTVGSADELGSANVSTEIESNDTHTDDICSIVTKKNTLSYSSGTISGNLSFNVFNNTDSIITARMITALYSGDGKLVSILKNNDEILGLGANYIDLGTLNYRGLNDTSYCVKCFVWDTIGEMKPLSPAVSVNID